MNDAINNIMPMVNVIFKRKMKYSGALCVVVAKKPLIPVCFV
jgi:hypothetical protein